MDRKNRMTGKEWRRERQATESQIERVNMTHTHTHTHRMRVTMIQRKKMDLWVERRRVSEREKKRVREIGR